MTDAPANNPAADSAADTNADAAALPPSPRRVRERMLRLLDRRDLHRKQHQRHNEALTQVRDYLAISEQVSGALEQLGQQLFADVLGVLEEKLSIALQEVLDQPIRLKAVPDHKRGSATIDFHIERAGEAEDILKGQGGSVANVLSVGLRMFALTQLDEQTHRRLLILDEQDCWLRPDLVPRLVKIIHEAGRALGFQVLLISHHDVNAFEQYADCIYQFIPQPDQSVRVRRWESKAKVPDEG